MLQLPTESNYTVNTTNLDNSARKRVQNHEKVTKKAPRTTTPKCRRPTCTIKFKREQGRTAPFSTAYTNKTQVQHKTTNGSNPEPQETSQSPARKVASHTKQLPAKLSGRNLRDVGRAFQIVGSTPQSKTYSPSPSLTFYPSSPAASMSFTLKQQVEMEQITDFSKAECASVVPRWQRKALAARSTPTKAAPATSSSTAPTKTPSKTPKKVQTPKVSE